MRIAAEGTPFILAGLVVTALLGVLGALGPRWVLWLAAVALVGTLFTVWFFRDPDREPPPDADAVLAPGDGKVVEISTVEPPEALGDDPVTRISIFLSVFNVHVQRSPVAGTVFHYLYRPGGYAIAWKPKASDENEQAELGILAPTGDRVLVKQIAGLIARRIVTWPRPERTLYAGERIGLIRFGSRVDLFIPTDWPVETRVGDAVTAGATILARMPGIGAGREGRIMDTWRPGTSPGGEGSRGGT